MKSYTVHVSDPSGFDDSTEVVVNDGAQLGQAVHLALDELMARHRTPIMFPLFVDVHPTKAYAGNAWMFKELPLGSGSN